MSDETPDEPIWTPDEDPRYQRMAAANGVYEQVHSIFSGLEDLPELNLQASALGMLQSLMSMESQFVLTNLIKAIQESCPPVVQDRIVKRYRVINAKSQAMLEQMRAKNLDEMTKRSGESWKSGEKSEWNPDTDGDEIE